MNDERNTDRQGERDSQVSAMFDGELSAAECELLARRLTRDDALRSQWSRFALIGAALRAERGVKLDDRVARRVQSLLAQEPSYGDSATVDSVPATARPAAAGSVKTAREGAYERWLKFARPVVGVSIAAGVAAVSIMWLRTQGPEPATLAAAPASQTIVLQPEASDAPTLVAAVRPTPAPVSNGEPERYTTPAPSSQTNMALPAHLANYVVAHSEYSGPLARRMALLGIVGTEASDEGAPDAADAAANKPADKPANTGAVDAP